ncbi:head decoration protein [Chengkuizengella axinellae]|uniref:Head decoration protein n=1 Tax=Chengkuizengella axinellae TaxID=3064388 RepID=A0ABT9J692_9BACL|nr:head decoration protein [Chengkuizengella sp. 2205SS18-9]MDP5277150.1 head decoration protein [Chengkuizengella sp. 2205SS18-9]
MPEQLVNNLGSKEFENLVAGGQQNVTTIAVTLKSGSAYIRGSVLGLVSADKKAVLVDSTKGDGSQRPYGILTDDIDATNGEMPAVVYLTGEFNEDKLTFGGADTADTHRQTLRDLGIFIKKIG